jgi:hypothetical protein
MTIPGVKQRTAEVLIAEIGVDMSAPYSQASRVVGQGLPRQRRISRQTPLWQDRQGPEMAESHPDRIGDLGHQNQELLSRRAIPAPPWPPRPLKGHHRGQPLDPDRHVAHAPKR